VLGLFALGLLCKPTLVTLPFVLLLLDYGRWGDFTSGNGERSDWRATRASLDGTTAGVEKTPLFLLAVVSLRGDVRGQERARVTMEALPLGCADRQRPGFVRDLSGALLFPNGLAVFYPYPEAALPIWKIAGACLVLVGISAAVLVCRRRALSVCRLAVDLGMLVPMIGLLQVGTHAMADRYAY